MIIFVLPGFTSHNPNRKFDILKKHLPNATIVGLTYNSNDPKVIYNFMCTSINNAMVYYNTQEIAFFGTSLGGFWAKHLSKIYKCKSVMVNPSLDPMKSLAQHVGLNKNVYTNDILALTAQNVKDYKHYYSIGNSTDTLVLLDKGDELFNYSDTEDKVKNWTNTEIITYEGGNHSFEHLKDSLPAIQQFLEYNK